MNRALDDIAGERSRQIHIEGWSTDYDDQHTDRSLAAAAATYAWLASLSDNDRQEQIKRQSYRQDGLFAVVQTLWPRSWHDRWFKPKDRRRDLVRAAALIVAEIERIDRVQENRE